MVSSPNLLGAAVLRGIVPAEDARAGLVRVRPLARSNEVHVIEHRGVPVAYVKQAGAAARADGDDTAAIEARVLAAIAPLRLAPAPILQGGSGPVWMTALPGAELSTVREPALLRAGAVELGRALARLHRLPLHGLDLPDAPAPWPLLDKLPPSMAGGAALADARPVLDAVRAPAMARALHGAREQWRPTHLVHGDVAAGNVLVDVTSSGATRVGLVDFELGGRGCPAVDLTSAVTMLTDLSPTGVDLAGACLTAYRDACGPAEPSAAWRCVRALMTAWQVALTHGEPGAATVRHLVSRATELAEEVAA